MRSCRGHLTAASAGREVRRGVLRQVGGKRNPPFVTALKILPFIIQSFALLSILIILILLNLDTPGQYPGARAKTGRPLPDTIFPILVPLIGGIFELEMNPAGFLPVKPLPLWVVACGQAVADVVKFTTGRPRKNLCPERCTVS